jgi:putative membrane protein
MLFATVKFLHLFALLFLFAASLIKNLLLRQQPVERQAVANCLAADRVSGAAAGLVVLSGIGLLYFSPKGMAFYTANSLFWLKIGLLIAASALIIHTKVYFRKAVRPIDAGSINVPRSVDTILKFDLASLVLMAYLGVLVVSGIGSHY